MSKKRLKIFFLIDATFSERDFARFGIDKLIRANFQVCLWDFSGLRGEAISTSRFERNVGFEKVSRHFFKDFKELNKKIKEVDGAFIVDQRSAIYKTHTTCWFQDNGSIVVKLEQGLMPLSIWSPSIKDYLIILRNSIINEGVKKTWLRVMRQLNIGLVSSNKVQCYDIKVCSGSASKCTNGEFEIRSHSFDYDIYLEEKNNKEVNEDYIVFLDNGMVHHPDYAKLGISPYCSADIYYPLLRSFFNKVEKQTGFQIKVALHPRLKIDEDIIDKFGGRELSTGKSAELVKYAQLVLAHDSTSINYAVLWGIPLLIVTTDQLEKRIYPSMEALTQILGTSRININKSYENLDFFDISCKPISQYNYFIDKLIKVNGSPDKNSAEILIEGLKKYAR